MYRTTPTTPAASSPRPSRGPRPGRRRSRPLPLLAAALALGALPLGCAGGPATHPPTEGGPGAAPGPEGAAAGGPTRAAATTDAPAPAIERATRALDAGDVVTARRELEAHLDDEPEDGQAHYLLARALAAQGELRAARRAVERSVAFDPQGAIAWSLLAALCEQMGDHRRALQAYAEVHRLVPEWSLDPLHGMARCLLFLGEPEQALSLLAAARQRPVKDLGESVAVRDPLTEYLAFQATRRLDRPEEAEAVARDFLEILATRSQADREAHANTQAEVRRWLEQRKESLDVETRRVMVEAARAGCKLRLPGAEDPEDAVLAQAPPRLFAFDERPVFVTFFPATGDALRGRGRGKNLAAALKGAIQAVQELPGYTPLAVKDAAVQVEVGHTLEPITIRPGPDGGLATEPALVRGLHGIALRVDRQEAYCLPGEGLTQNLPDLVAMLTHATARAGLSTEAWQGASAAFRFETEAWLSPGPGLTFARLELGEPTPLPQGLPGELREAVHAGARWLTTQLRPTNVPASGPDGPAASATMLARRHDPTGRSFDPTEATPLEGARVALACAGAHARTSDPVLLAAAEHLLTRLLPSVSPDAGGRGADPTADPAVQAELEASVLATLGLLAKHRRTPGTTAEARRALAERLHASATPATRAHVVLALATELARTDALAPPAGPSRRPTDPARDTTEAPADRATAQPAAPLRAALRDLLPGLVREPALDAIGVLALVAAEEVQPGLGAGDAALAWGQTQLDVPGPAAHEPIARARRVAALARVARLAARRGAPEAERLRAQTLEQARGLLALQLGARHRHFVRNGELALGGFRAETTRAELHAAVTAECVLALLACLEL